MSLLARPEKKSRAEDKKITDRKRNLIILIEKYLLDQGYVESVMKIEHETTINMENWEVADNIDLYMILCEYEQFYEYKFGKEPKLTKKLEEITGLKRPPMGGKRKTMGGTSTSKLGPSSKNGQANPSDKLPKILGALNNSKLDPNDPLGLAIDGKTIEVPKKKEEKADDEEYFMNRVFHFPHKFLNPINRS
jgi:katanin p60 ATPase-containing subunit A1